MTQMELDEEFNKTMVEMMQVVKTLAEIPQMQIDIKVLHELMVAEREWKMAAIKFVATMKKVILLDALRKARNDQ